MKSIVASWTAVVGIAFVGCGGPDEGITYNEEGDHEIAESESAAITRNGITRNGITRNGITRNGITRNGLNTSPNDDVTSRGLDGRRFHVTDPESTVLFLEYVASCALSPAQTVDVIVNNTSHQFQGQMSLATEWATQSCNGTCQRWVTSCLLARTNAYGTEVPISVRSSRTPATLAEKLEYSQQEGAFFGNLFSDQVEMYACAGTMFDNLVLGSLLSKLQYRICADAPSSECPMVVTGPCRDFLLPPWALSIERTCGSSSDDAYSDCRNRLGTPLFPLGATNYREVMTTYLSPLTNVWWLL
jgi:hypothetical protein